MLARLKKWFGGGAPSPAPHAYLLLGLGNPGQEYANTRHNIGWMAVDQCAEAFGCGKLNEGDREVAFGRILWEGRELVIAKSLTYMNCSGRAAAKLVKWLEVSLDQLIVAHDDLAFDLGQVKLKFNQGPGSHNGVRSITQTLGSQAFHRLRLGIGPAPDIPGTWADFVLSPFKRSEAEAVEVMLACTRQAMELILRHGPAKAQALLGLNR